MVCLLLRRNVLHGHGRECKHSQAYCSIYRHLKPDVCAHRYIVEWCGTSINRPPGDHSCVTTQLPSTLRLFCSKFYKMCKSRSLQIQRAVMCQQWPSCLPVVGARGISRAKAATLSSRATNLKCSYSPKPCVRQSPSSSNLLVPCCTNRVASSCLCGGESPNEGPA